MGRRTGSPGRGGRRRGRATERGRGRAEVAVTAAGLLLAGLFISAVGLRTQLVGIGPLLPDIQRDLDVSHAAVGLLVTVPLLCMGVFAPFAPVFGTRLGFRVSIAACLALVA